jgi:hypothetical protein
MGFRSGKDEFYVGGRFFQCLEECVEGTCGKHVNFIDDENFKSATGGKIFDILSEFTNILDTGVGSTVDLEYIHGISGRYLKTRRAGVARFRSRSFFALEGFGENTRSTGFTDPAGTSKQKGMGNPARLDCILQRPADMLLTDKITECLWSPFSR